MAKYLILGANGQLGSEFIKTLDREGKDYIGVGHGMCDVASLSQVIEVFDKFRPQITINCTAYNLVDRAEQEYHKSYETNALGVKNLAYLCKKYGSYLITYSTDYVFDGTKEGGLYTEEDVPCPINEYGKSKLTGERWLIDEGINDYLILRTSWVYGQGRQNFIYKLFTWARTNKYLKISYDEISVPTSTNTIVDITLKAIDRGLIGIYHLTNSGYGSRYEWAKEVLKILGSKIFIYPVSKDTFNLAAKRPGFSAMSNEKIIMDLNVDIPKWEEELANFMRNFQIPKE